jgi:4-carboxymuconolactone decarboxylase
MSVDPRYRTGETTRREVLGDAHVDRSIAESTEFSAPLLGYMTGAGWADVWSRPGLDRRSRSCVTLGVLTALRAHDELRTHLRGAIRNGLSTTEIAEVLLHTAAYAGIPAANSAFRIAQDVLVEMAELPRG